MILLAVAMFAVTGGSLVGPILPAMLVLEGATGQNVGLALSAYSFSAMIATPVLGSLADRLGRKNVLVPSVLLFGLGGLLITLTQSFWLVLVWRSLQGVGVGGMMNTVTAAIGDMYEEPHRSRVMGWRVTVQSSANATVPFVSGAIATLAWFLPFYVHSLALVLALVMALKLEEPAGSPAPRRYVRRALAAVANVRAIWLFSSNLVGFALLYGLVVYVPLLVVEQLGRTTLDTGLAISTAAGVAAITASQTGRVARQLSDEVRVLWGFACCGLSHLLVAHAGTYPWVIVCMVIWGLGFGVLMATLNSAAAGLVGSDLRAGVLSVFTLLTYLGQSASPPFFSLFIHDTTVSGVFVAGSVVALLPLTFTVVVLMRGSPSAEPPPPP